MDNYPYIIAGLPDLSLSFEKSEFDYGALRNELFGACSEQDRRLIEWMEFGFKDDNLSPHFYRASAKCKNPFIKQYFEFDRILRTEKVAFLNHEQTESEFEEKGELLKIFELDNIIERERRIDLLMWEKVNDILGQETLNVNVILAFLAKAHIVERWSRLDKVSGEALFRKFVDEINATHREASARLKR